MPEAARITDRIGHVSIWARLARVALRVGSSLVEGLAVAAVITLAVGGSVATMGCGAIIAGGLIAGFIGAASGWSDYKEKKIQELTENIGSPTITGMLTLMGSPNVFINNLLAARAITDAALCGNHSGPPIPVAEGSDSIWINTFPAARKGDKVQCAANIVDGSSNVFFGGNKTAYLEVADDKEWWETGLELAIGLAMGRGGFPGRIGCMGLGLVAGMAGDMLGRGFRSLFGNPVNPATGGKVLMGDDDTDFALPGVLPIEWRRRYSSSDTRVDGPFGAGWSVPCSVELHLVRRGSAEEASIYIDEQGRKIDMPAVQPGHGIYNTAELLTLGCTPGGHYEVQTSENLFYQFGAAAEKPGDQVLRLQRLRDRNGNWIAYRWDAAGRLINMADNLGRLLRFEYDTKRHPHRIRAVYLEQGAGDETPGKLVQYEYDSDGQLATVIDRTQRIARSFAYADGVMVRQSLPSGLECYYDWESQASATGPDHTRRVLRHWTNDGERYEVRYDVHTDGGVITGGDTQAIDQLGRQYSWSWDARYNLTAFTDPLGRRWTMAYNANSQLLRVVNPGGDALSFAYNEHGLPIVQTDALGRSTRTMWDDRWFVPRKITLADGSSEHYDYDEHGNNTGVVDAAGNETRYAYDHHGLLVAITDAKGGLKRLAWNAQAQLSAYTDCSGYTTRYSYDGWTWLKSVTDAAGFTTLLTHDAMGRVQGVSTPDGAHERYHYDAAGQLVGITDALSRETRFALNTRGQLVARQDAEQRTVALTYDPAHRAQSLINENGERFEFIYDAADRVVEERRVGGTRVTIDYDANGWPTAVTHHPGLGDDVLLATEHGTSSTTGQTPEISGWGDGTAGAAQAGRAGSQALRTEFIRDVAGRLLQKRTANHHYHYRYDTVDQLLSATKLQVQPDGSLQPLHTTTFEYDLVGNLIAETATDAQTGQSHRLTHSHDPLGNRTQTVLPALAGPEGQAQMERALNYLHYGSGHLHQINLSQRDTHAPDAQAIHQLICDIERDNLHQEILRSQGKAQTRFAYDPVGRLTGAWSQSSSQVSQPFGPKDPGAPAWQQALEQLAAPATSARSGHTHGLLKAWRYDKVGELRASRHSLQGDKGHSYDATGRILQTQHGALGSIRSPLPQAANETFGYDPAGNIQDNATQQAVHSSTALSQRGYVRDNLVRVFEDKRYFYDGHGRLIRKLAGKHTDQSFNWDEENNLLEVRTTRRPGTEHQSTQTTRFDYDALGRRVAKHDHFGTTVFIWEGMRLIEERRGQSVISYVYEPGSYVPLARLDAQGQATEQGGLGTTQDAEPGNTPETIAASVHSTGAGGQKNYQSQQAAANDTNDAEAQYWEALDTQTGTAQKTGTEAKLCDVYYFHTDQAGLPQELTNAQGQLVWQANYKTWGSTVSEEWEVKSLAGQQVHSLDQGDIPTQEDGKQQNLRFQGQYLDRETGLHYNTFRYYDADIGRFICPDPIGLDGGINLNGYVPNPFGWIDPLGWDWNYNLTDAKGNVYYHGRASDNQSMSDVMRRHGNNVGTDGKPRMGAGDTINRTTPVGTPRDTVRGIENNGTRTNGTLGRGGTSVRGNIDQGISDSKLKTKAGQARVNAANDHLRANGAKTAGNLKPLESKKFTPKKGC